MIDECCTKEMFDMLQNEIDLKAPQMAIDELQDTLEFDFMKQEAHQIYAQEMEDQLEDLRDTIAERSLITEVQRFERELKKQIERNHDKASVARDCQRDKKDLQK